MPIWPFRLKPTTIYPSGAGQRTPRRDGGLPTDPAEANLEENPPEGNWAGAILRLRGKDAGTFRDRGR
jgi:hypothetical protein